MKPLVERLVRLIEEKRPFIGLHLGSGGREVDRQVIRKLIGKKHIGQAVLIGVDISPVANELARENFRELEPFITIREVEDLNEQTLREILANEQKRHIVIFAKNDIFDLPKRFPKGTFDVVYHTLFKHHLSEEQRKRLDEEVAPLGKKILEYDGYRSWGVVLPQTLTGWNYPPFLNAELFSNFRFLDKENIEAKMKGKEHTYNARVGTYLAEWESE